MKHVYFDATSMRLGGSEISLVLVRDSMPKIRRDIALLYFLRLAEIRVQEHSCLENKLVEALISSEERLVSLDDFKDHCFDWELQDVFAVLPPKRFIPGSASALVKVKTSEPLTGIIRTQSMTNDPARDYVDLLSRRLTRDLTPDEIAKMRTIETFFGFETKTDGSVLIVEPIPHDSSVGAQTTEPVAEGEVKTQLSKANSSFFTHVSRKLQVFGLTPQEVVALATQMSPFLPPGGSETVIMPEDYYGQPVEEMSYRYPETVTPSDSAAIDPTDSVNFIIIFFPGFQYSYGYDGTPGFPRCNTQYVKCSTTISIPPDELWTQDMNGVVILVAWYKDSQIQGSVNGGPTVDQLHLIGRLPADQTKTFRLPDVNESQWVASSAFKMRPVGNELDQQLGTVAMYRTPCRRTEEGRMVSYPFISYGTDADAAFPLTPSTFLSPCGNTECEKIEIVSALSDGSATGVVSQTREYSKKGLLFTDVNDIRNFKDFVGKDMAIVDHSTKHSTNLGDGGMVLLGTNEYLDNAHCPQTGTNAGIPNPHTTRGSICSNTMTTIRVNGQKASTPQYMEGTLKAYRLAMSTDARAHSKTYDKPSPAVMRAWESVSMDDTLHSFDANFWSLIAQALKSALPTLLPMAAKGIGSLFGKKGEEVANQAVDLAKTLTRGGSRAPKQTKKKTASDGQARSGKLVQFKKNSKGVSIEIPKEDLPPSV